MAIGELASGVRLHVYESFVARGHPPTMQEMADKSGAPAHEVIRALVHLEQSRALILNPARDRVVVAPPFSAIPTPFWVETSAGSWWGNCAWESLGIAALLDQDAVVRTTAGAQGRPLEIRTSGGAVAGSGAVMHIPVPAAHWWDDVRFTCATILFFSTREEVDEWSARHDIPTGSVLDLGQAWSLAQDWFTGRLDRDWRRLTPAEAAESFDRVGLRGHFWTLG
ncbi:MAG TPA: alkylmercury lyase family protein [Actinomycetota bacterium]|nr:alkylmercury lyase family protein [Actinomycetota bacterium]